MDDTRSYTVFPSNLNLLECFRNFKKLLDKLRLNENHSFCRDILYYLKISDSRNLSCRNLDEFLEILEQYSSPVSIRTHSHWGKETKDSYGISINIGRSEIEIAVSSNDLNAISGMHERLSEIFKATNPPNDRSERISKYNLKKSIFVAHRFDEIGNKAAQVLIRFLTRLRFAAIEGSGYETRDIPDKVSDKIRSQDIFICIVTPGDSTWIMSETAFAKALNKYIIILCQESFVVNKGIIGNDYEYVSFPENTIEKSFNDLLYALPY